MRAMVMVGDMMMPGRWVICDECDGNGSHSKDFGAISAEEWHGPDWDDESREAYLAGAYDKPCRECRGSGKVAAVDVARCSFAMKRELVAMRRSARWAEESRREREREARMLGEWS